MPQVLRSLRASGKLVFLATNSLWDYTNVVMNHLLLGRAGERGRPPPLPPSPPPSKGAKAGRQGRAGQGRRKGPPAAPGCMHTAL